MFLLNIAHNYQTVDTNISLATANGIPVLSSGIIAGSESYSLSSYGRELKIGITQPGGRTDGSVLLYDKDPGVFDYIDPILQAFKNQVDQREAAGIDDFGIVVTARPHAPLSFGVIREVGGKSTRNVVTNEADGIDTTGVPYRVRVSDSPTGTQYVTITGKGPTDTIMETQDASGLLHIYDRSSTGLVIDGKIATADQMRAFDKIIGDPQARPYSLADGGLGSVKKVAGQNRRVEYLADGTEHRYADGENFDVFIKDGNTEIKIRGNPLPFDFSDFGGILFSQLGYRLADGDVVTGVIYSAALKTLGNNLGDAVDELVGGGKSVGEAIEDGFSSFGPEFLGNLKEAGIGAVSSYLTAELVNAVGLKGLAGEAANAIIAPVISQITSNLLTMAAGGPAADGVTVFTNVGPQLILSATASFVGSKLSNEIYSPDTIGGQIGGAVGSAAASIINSAEIALALSTGNPLIVAAAFVDSIIRTIVFDVIGSFIGSIFGGTPRSGADASWDAAQGRFVVANAWSRKGGSIDTAKALAGSVVNMFNGVLAATGGTLLDPELVQSGSYGMRKKDFTYRPVGGGSDKDNITQTFGGNDAAGQLIGYGIYTGLTDPDFKIAGGDIYVKRALYNGIEQGGFDAKHFDTSALLGNLSSAQQYESYLANANVINALVAAEPNSVFTIETLLTLARADELGLTRRAASDWYGGFDFVMNAAKADANAVNFAFDYDPASGKISRQIAFGDFVLADAIDVAGQTVIESGGGNDTIDLRGNALANQVGLTVDGKFQNDLALSGSDFTAKTGTLNFAASERRKTFEVMINASDAAGEVAETFLANLSNATGMTILGRGATAVITESTLATLMVGASYANESDGYAVFRLSLSKAASNAVSVSLALADARGSGLGVDYGARDASNLQTSSDGVTWTNATMATFAAGSTELFVRTAVKKDNGIDAAGKATNVEGNETFSLTATVISGASVLANGATPVVGTGTIVDGSSAKPIVWIDNIIVNEATGTAKFTVSRSNVTAARTTVAFATADRRVLDIDIAATVDGGDGNDTIYASNLGDNLFGGAGNDRLYGGRLDDWLLGGDGDDYLDAGTADSQALGGDGNYLSGGAGNDILMGREGSDWLDGGDGIDSLVGADGDDILAGGAGDGDNLKGGVGSDQYIVRRGDGVDVAEEDATGAPGSNGAGDAISERLGGIERWKVNPGNGGAIRPDWIGTSPGVQAGAVAGGADDAIVFGDGIDIGDIRLQRSGTNAAPGNDLIIQVMTTANKIETFSGTQLTIRDWFTNPFKRVEWLRFADGNEIQIGNITSFVVGGSGNDVLVGTSGNDFVYGGAGNDKLYLLAGDDVGNGGTGDDMVAGDAGRDLIIGGLGNDDLMGGAGADAITGDGGADDIYGGGDRDVLSGGRGDGDVIVGGAGDDTFRYGRGDGRDMVFDEYVNYWAVVWTAAGGWNAAAGFVYNVKTGDVTGPGGVVIRKNFGTGAAPDFQWLGRYDYDSVSKTLKIFNPPANAATITANAGVDTIEFAPGINLQDVILHKRSGSNDLVLAISSEDEELGDTSLVKDSITIKDWYLAPGQIEKLAFYQTGILDIAPAKMTLIAGTDGADGAMATPLQGTSIADWITGGAGDDVIAGGAGNDILAGNSGFDTLKGEAGDDVLYGGTGNDSLDGGTGRDILIGGAGQDTASYASASAAVRAQLSASWSNAGDASGDEYHAIEDVTGGSGADVLGGTSSQNELVGGLGNDTLEGNGGDDTYVWNVGDGADTIIDGSFVVEEAVTLAGALGAGYTVSWDNTGTVSVAGSTYWRLQIRNAANELVHDDSTYSYSNRRNPAAPSPSIYRTDKWLGGFARTNGIQVTRQKYDAAVNGGTDELEFGQNISLGDLTFIKSGNDLIVRYGQVATSQVTIRNQLLANSSVEALKLRDGLSVSLTSIAIATGAAQLVGSAGDDLLVGQTGALADNLAGADGNDTLVGYAGDDSLSGGNGDDVFEGGLGADRLEGGANSLSSSGPNAGDTARYVRSAAAVSVNLTLASAQGGVMGAESVGDILIGIENVTGSAFDDTLTGDANDNRLFGLDGIDMIRGGAGADVLVGDGGDDMLYGDAGEDNIAGGGGNDTIYGGTEKDVLDGSDGADTIYGEAGDDRLTGGAGIDLLDGGDGDDVLSGASENDRLTGGSGNDTLSGGLGNDTLAGGLGNDVYAFEQSSGQDTLTDLDGTNNITFDASVAYDKIWLTRVGNDLRIGVIGGDTVTIVTGFFLATGQSRIRAIETTTHAIFLDHPDTLRLVTAMTAATATPGVTPSSMPTTVTPLLSTYWHAGGKAAPTGPASARTVTVIEDGSVMLNGSYGVIDHDASVLTYSLKVGGKPTKGMITAFNTATGALTYTPFADANGADSFVVIATDSDNQAVELPVSVTITPVNDAPRNVAVNGGVLTILESAPGSTTSNGSVIGQFTALDVEGDPIIYTLADNAGGRFSISATGQLRVLGAALLDHELAASHIIKVTVTDSIGASITVPFTVTIGNVNEAPDAPARSTSRGIVAEFVSGVNTTNVGTLVQQFTVTDPDGAPAPTLKFVADATGNPGSRFRIVGNQVRFALEPDFAGLVAAGFTIADSDGDGLGEVTLTGKVIASDGSLSSAASTSFSVRVEDVNQQHTAITLTGAVASIDERDRLAAGTARPAVILGTIGVTDPDLATQNSGKHNFAVYENGSTTVSTRFAVDAGNRLTLLAGQSIDFETDGASITLRVRATDRSASPLALDQTFTFTIIDKDDVLEGTASADVLTGQRNRDILRGLAGNDILAGLAGDDSLEGGDGNDILNGGDGNDTLSGQSNNDVLNGDAGNDGLWGGDGADVLQGGAGNDTLNGETGNDGVRAAGTDTWRGFIAVGLAGGDGDDVLNGGDGDDYLDGGLGADKLNGGLGTDGVTYAGSTAAVTVNLATNSASGGSAQGDTYSGIELVQGSRLGDTITGSAAGNIIYGGAGNDTIRGGAGEDFMFGGDGDDVIDAESGNDYLDGGAGNDILRGGADNDTYYIGRNGGNDRIQNFDSTGTNFDHITFDGAVLYTDVWFDRVDDTGAVSASGSHLKMTLVGAAGTEGSVTVDNWFADPGRLLPANYFKIDLISDGSLRAALPVNVEALVTLMAGIPPGRRPTTQAQMASLRSGNVIFSNALEDNWGRLSAPKISNTDAVTGVEPLDGAAQTVSFSVRARFEDDQGLGITIPASNIDLTISTTGGNVLSQFVTAINYGTPDVNGNRVVTLTLAANASTHLLPGGVLPLQLKAQIRGTTRTTIDALTLTIRPTADTPVLTQLSSAGGNAGLYLPIHVAGTSPDTDGSERTDILISGLPVGYIFTNGSGQAVGTQEGAWWRLTAAQAATLHMYTPAGSGKDALLAVKTQTIDGTSVRDGATRQLRVEVNGAPTSLALRGTGRSATPRLKEFVSGVSATSGVNVGVVVPTDPDSLELNLISTDFTLLPRAGQGEERIVSTTGPLGGTVSVLETGQIGTGGGSAGGGVRWADGGPADTTSAYKFTIYFKPENDSDQTLYFGTSGNVQDATNGVANVNPYFWSGTAASLVQDRWYRIEGYVLPEGTAIIGNDVYGGVFDTVTGAKVANSYTFRFGTGGSNTGARFFSSYGSQQGYSAQWYQPVVEKLDYTYALDDNAGGRFAINAVTGLVTAVGTNFDHETAASHNIVVRVTDAGGLARTQKITVTIDNVNERPNAPGGGGTVRSFFDETGLGANPAVAGSVVQTFAMSDPDGSRPGLKFASGGNPNNWFTIIDNQVRLAAGLNFDFETLRANGGYNIYDWNGDGRLEAHIADVRVVAVDGALTSAPTLLQVFISDVNERPNNLIVEAANLFSETINGDAAHSGNLIARFTMADPDGPSPTLVILDGNANGWFQSLYGNHLAFSDGVNFSADWLRASKGQYGIDSDFYYDTDGDGLKEIRVATLTVAAQDANGARSDPFTYNVLIEDKNEAPVWDMDPFTFDLYENAIPYQQVGTIRGSDIDGPADELRYVLSNWDWYFDGYLGKQVSRTPDQRFVVSDDGNVYVNGSQNINFDDGLRTLSYSTLIYDKALGANNTYRFGTLNINIRDLNEPHTLTSTGNFRPEGSYSPYPVIQDLNAYYDLRSLMLYDPENGDMNWTFANGTNVSGIWTLEGPTGRLYLTSGTVDYEQITKVYGWVDEYEFDPETKRRIRVGREWEWTGARDYALATQQLSIMASDGVHSSVATFSATISDVNEGPSLRYMPRFIVRDDQGSGNFGRLYGYDPETGALASSYSIQLIGSEEQFISPGGGEDIDNTSNPYVYVGWNGDLSFYVVNDGEWEGGIRSHPVYGGRWSYQLVYRMSVTMTDASGVSNTEPFEIIFLKHGTSGVLPIILDLDGDGIEMVDLEKSPIQFDMNNDGVRDQTGWVGADDGLLVLDRNGNGIIDDAREISFAADDQQAVTDLEGLRAWDSNRNGFLEAGDTDFARFQIWRDRNQNGISEAGELFSLTALSIKSINLTLDLTGNELVGDRNVLFATSQFQRIDGSTGLVGDVSLAFDPADAPASVAPPIVFDLDNDNAGLVALPDSAALFDMNGDGIADKTGWIEQGDALLALDRNGNGTIDGIAEISFVGDKAGAKTDLEGLAAFDSNADGVLDGEDVRFVEFRLWRDGNSDGKTDAGELLSLAEAGVTSISLSGTATGETLTAGSNIIYNTGSYSLGGGATGRLLDVGLAFKPLSALPEIKFQTSSWAGKAKGYRLTASGGTVHVTPRHVNGSLSADAGQIDPSAILSFGNRSVGLLSAIIVDLDGDGLEARRAEKTGALFDMDADGVTDDTGWMSGGDGMLVIDRDGNGTISHASELSFLSEKADAKSAWEGLGVLDNTKDGKIDKSDARFGELKVWTDRNGDGISQADELKSLSDMGITEIGLRSTTTSDSAKIGYNVPLSTATFKWSNGVTATIGNVALAFDPGSTKTKAGGASLGTTPSELTAAANAARMMQAMSAFGVGGPDSALMTRSMDRQTRLDWFTAAAA